MGDGSEYIAMIDNESEPGAWRDALYWKEQAKPNDPEPQAQQSRIIMYVSTKEEAIFAASCGFDFLSSPLGSCGYFRDDMHAVCRGTDGNAIVEIVRFIKND